MRLDECDSDNIEDRRGDDCGGFSSGGGQIGIAGIMPALVVSYFTGINPLAVMGLVQEHGLVRPDTATHGTSAQRVHWFEQGIESGDPRQCNPFARGTGLMRRRIPCRQGIGQSHGADLSKLVLHFVVER